jgi:hypothetical protein
VVWGTFFILLGSITFNATGGQEDVNGLTKIRTECLSIEYRTTPVSWELARGAQETSASSVSMCGHRGSSKQVPGPP